MRKRKIHSEEKVFYHDNNEALSNEVPGVGQYSSNPLISPKGGLKCKTTDYKFWIEKHNKI